jgi:hypothetical protein
MILDFPSPVAIWARRPWSLRSKERKGIRSEHPLRYGRYQRTSLGSQQR